MTSHFDRAQITPPKIDEFELTFFGPGFGESIVVHIPGIGWGVIDSCEFKLANQKYVPPLDYLTLQNANSLAFVILTHPHRDHFGGMEQIINNYLGKICRVCRYSGESVRELGAYLTNQGIKGKPGAKMLASVFGAFKEAVERGAEKRHLGAMTQVIPRKKVSVTGKTFEVEVLSLSPLAMDEESYVNILRRALPKVNGELEEIPDHKHNLIACALWISVGEVVVILGSDVEKGSTRSSGWRGIVNSVDGPDLCVNALKVAHHGSASAYCRKAWEKHCKRGNIISVITPYNRGTVRRPSEDDIQRIGSYSDSVGVTSQLKYLRALEVYDRAVARRLPKKWRVVDPPIECGMLTMRYDLQGNMTLQNAVPPANWVQTSG
jgi:hypothetical protein